MPPARATHASEKCLPPRGSPVLQLWDGIDAGGRGVVSITVQGVAMLKRMSVFGFLFSLVFSGSLAAQAAPVSQRIDSDRTLLVQHDEVLLVENGDSVLVGTINQWPSKPVQRLHHFEKAGVILILGQFLLLNQSPANGVALYDISTGEFAPFGDDDMIAYPFGSYLTKSGHLYISERVFCATAPSRGYFLRLYLTDGEAFSFVAQSNCAEVSDPLEAVEVFEDILVVKWEFQATNGVGVVKRAYFRDGKRIKRPWPSTVKMRGVKK